MLPILRREFVPCLFLIAGLAACLQAEDSAVALRKGLRFHASFDSGTDEADLASGDRRLWHAPSMDRKDAAQPGLPPSGEVTRLPQAGRFGGALKFSRSSGPMVFFRAERNFPAITPDWSGTVSFWLSTDPANELNEGFCDPLQITSKAWDDASVFVEFEKRPAGIPFRFGVYADKTVWNPTDRKFAEIPAAERPLAAVEKPPFGAGQWTHIAVVLSHFNTGKADGLSQLYLNGKLAGEISPRTQTFTWDQNQAAIMLGLSYIGLMDDLAIFDRALTSEEVEQLFALPNGVRDLHADTK